MSARQLRLLAPSRPLTETFGRDFFRAIPKSPGVYLMYDARQRLAYVGQSKNLRQRLASYRHVHPDRHSRKLVRLVHTVVEIKWEECADAAAARIRENQLLRLHRPRFNTVNTYPQAYLFITLSGNPDRVELSIGPDQSAPVSYGAFKRGSLVGYASLVRLLWSVWHQPQSIHDMPRRLFCFRVPSSFALQVRAASPKGLTPDELLSQLDAFFRGVSSELLTRMQAALSPFDSIAPFHRALYIDDLANASAFFRSGPARNHQLQQLRGNRGHLIAKEELDDLLVWKSTLAATGSSNAGSLHFADVGRAGCTG